MKHDKRAAGKSSPQAAKSLVTQGESAISLDRWKPILKRYLPVAAVLFVALLAYSNSFQAPLLMDSDDVVLKDTRTHAVNSFQLHRILTQQYWETATTGLYRPLTTLSYLFNYAVLDNGVNPEGYHWVNFLLHGLTIVLVYALGLAIFDEIPAAVLLSALWGLHPVLTEAVTNVVGRADILSALSVLAALLCHRQVLRNAGPRRFAWLAALTLVVTAGMFSKESAVVAVAVLVAYDLAFERGVGWGARIPSYAAATLPGLVYLYVRSRVLAGVAYVGTPFCDNPLAWADFLTARMTAVKVIGKYLGLLVWPGQLSYDYSYNEIPLFGWALSNPEDAKAVIALAVCLIAIAAALYFFPRHRVVFFAVAFFFATLSPMSNLAIIIGTIMGERFLYLPSLGFAILAVYLMRLLWQRLPAGRADYRKAALAAVGIILFALAGRTYARNADWLDQQRLWRSGIVAAPGSFKTHLNATNSTFLTNEEWDRPIREGERSLAILGPLSDARNTPNAYREVGSLYRTIGENVASKKAAGTLTAGTTPEYWYRKSLDALLHSEKIELAWDAAYRRENQKYGIREVTSIPGKLYLELGRTYSRLGDPRSALTAFERGRPLESNPDLLEEMASAYRAVGDLHGAAFALVEALAMDSRRGQIGGSLVELYGKLDPNGCSISHDSAGASLNVQCPLVHNDICAASKNVAGTYMRRGQTVEAAGIRRTAVEELGCAPGLVN